MTRDQANKLWQQYGYVSWAKCIPQVRNMLEDMPFSPEMPLDQCRSIVQAASLVAARAYRLGFKIGTAVGEKEVKSKSRIITPDNFN